MKKFLLLFSLPILLTVAQAQNKFQQSVTQIIQTADEQMPFSGTVLIAEKGKIRYHQAFGYRTFADSNAIEANDVFELASVSKQFTAMIILMLKEKGLLQLDDAIDKYVSVPYKGITIRHLLTHTSGLPDYQAIMDQYWDKSKIAGNADIIAYLNQYAPPAKFAPGEKYDYSNTGYVLLASIAEKASGKDFIQLSREWIFQPLKMRETNIRTAQEKAALSNFALGHIYVPARKSFIRADSFPSSNYTIWLGNRKGPGRISSTATDLLKWDQALYSNKLISATTLAEAFQPMRLNNGQFSNYGFGWDLGADSTLGKVVSHNGDNPGYKTMIIRYIDTQQTIIVLCNNAHPAFNHIIAQLERLLASYKLAKL